MQAVLLCSSPLSIIKSRSTVTWTSSSKRIASRVRFTPIKATGSLDPATADYSSPTSVFPAEACETIGGDACDAQIFPEVKLATESAAKTNLAVEEVDREYVEYNEPKTVFPGEACDDLGGEFCEPEYQKGVYEEKTLAK